MATRSRVQSRSNNITTKKNIASRNDKKAVKKRKIKLFCF